MRFYFAPVSRHMRANFFVGGEGGARRRRSTFGPAQFFSASQVKKQETLEPTVLAKISPLGWRQPRGIPNVRWSIGPMPRVHSQNCRDSAPRREKSYVGDG